MQTEIKSFRPLSDRIVIAMDPFNAKRGRLFMPDNYKKEDFCLTGTVIQQGEGGPGFGISGEEAEEFIERILSSFEERQLSGVVIGTSDSSAAKRVVAEFVDVVRERMNKSKPLPTKVGDRVVFSRFAGNDVEINNQLCRVVRPDDIMAIFE